MIVTFKINLSRALGSMCASPDMLYVRHYNNSQLLIYGGEPLAGNINFI